MAESVRTKFEDQDYFYLLNQFTEVGNWFEEVSGLAEAISSVQERSREQERDQMT